MIARCFSCPTLLLAVTALTGGCASMAPIHPSNNIPPVVACPADGCGEALELSYIGSGGFLMRYGGQAVMTGGMVSNPRLSRVAWWWAHVKPDTAAIDNAIRSLERNMEGANRPALDEVGVIVIGHSHYDHLMDVPYIARRHAPRAKIFGSAGMKRLAARGVGAGNELEAIPQDSLGTAEREGHWYTVGNVRVMALRSEHGPNYRNRLFRYTYATGQPGEEPPRTGRDWSGGDTFAYLIDFLRPDGSIAFRVHFQDAASRPPLGFPPLASVAARPVDVAIVSAGAATNMAGYPDSLLAVLRPRHVVIGHWEDFFRKASRPPRAIRIGDNEELVARIDRNLPPGAGWSTPLPGATVRVYADPARGLHTGAP